MNRSLEERVGWIETHMVTRADFIDEMARLRTYIDQRLDERLAEQMRQIKVLLEDQFNEVKAWIEGVDVRARVEDHERRIAALERKVDRR